MTLPKIGRQGLHAGVEQVAVFKYLVVAVILGRQAQGAGLDAHIDVLGHQHHFAARQLQLQGLDDGQDLVVSLALRQTGRQGRIDQFGLEEQLAAGFAVTGMVERQALGHFRDAAGLQAGGERVELAADLAHIARDFGHALFVSVELFERDHRQVDVMFLETEQAHRVMHQDIGVEHEQLR